MFATGGRKPKGLDFATLCLVLIGWTYLFFFIIWSIRREDESRQSVLASLLGRWNRAMVDVRVGWMGLKDLLEHKRL